MGDSHCRSLRSCWLEETFRSVYATLSARVASFTKGTIMRYELGVFGTDEHHYEFNSARSALNSFQVATDDPDTFAAWVVEYADHDMLGFGRTIASFDR